jgi:hypothetical protein
VEGVSGASMVVGVLPCVGSASVAAEAVVFVREAGVGGESLVGGASVSVTI